MKVAHEFEIPGVEMNFMIMGRNDLMMFAACPGGIILSLKCPLQSPIEYSDFHLHCNDITKMALSYNEQTLISTSADGTLCLWKLSFTEGKAVKMDKEFTYSNEVLISRNDLEEKMQMIEGLTVRLRELETEHSYNVRQMEVQHNDKMREVHQGYCETIEELKDKIDRIQESHTNELNNINVEIVRMKSAHEEAMQKVEMNYDAKLIAEYDKYRNFEERNSAMRDDYEKRLTELENFRVKGLEELKIKYEAQVFEKTVQLEETHEEMAHQIRIHEQLKLQIEDDADREIVEIRTKYEAWLHEEKQMNLKLKGEAGVMRNKYHASQKEIEDLKRQVTHLHGEQVQFRKSIQDLEKDVVDLKKEIAERDVTIQDKERRIYDLKRHNQELEKFKFVLDYKIRELKDQIEPRNKEIKELKEKIQDMETELVNLHKTNISLELQLAELKEKLAAARREIQYEMIRNRKFNQLLRKIRIDLLDAARLLQDTNALKTAVMNLYHRYSDDDEFLRSRKADLDANCEFLEQREHLEKTVATLKKQAVHEATSSNKDVEKIMEENVELIEELNALRKELKGAQKHISDMESLLGLAGKDMSVTEARNKLAKACHGREELENTYKTRMQDCERMISALKENIERLLSKITFEKPDERKNL